MMVVTGICYLIFIKLHNVFVCGHFDESKLNLLTMYDEHDAFANRRWNSIGRYAQICTHVQTIHF